MSIFDRLFGRRRVNLAAGDRQCPFRLLYPNADSVLACSLVEGHPGDHRDGYEGGPSTGGRWISAEEARRYLEEIGARRRRMFEGARG